MRENEKLARRGFKIHADEGGDTGKMDYGRMGYRLGSTVHDR